MEERVSPEIRETIEELKSVALKMEAEITTLRAENKALYSLLGTVNKFMSEMRQEVIRQTRPAEVE